MKRECFEKENKFIESDMPGDIYLAIRVKTFVTFMGKSVTKESSRRRLVLKFVTIVRSNARDTLTTKDLELRVVRLNFKEDF